MDYNALVLLGIAIVNALGAYFAWRTKKDMRRVEINTNSMREQLVTATRVISHNAGIKAGRAESKSEIKDLTDQLKASEDKNK